MSVLDAIVQKKKERLERAKAKTPLAELQAMIHDMETPRDFGVAVKRDGRPVRFIAEIKRASPSKGMIRKRFAPKEIAAVYEKGADAISVLTEEDFFQGDLAYIQEVKGASSKPVLRKDFIVDAYQIYESRAAGADAILLIETLLEKDQAKEFLDMAAWLGMAALFEVHDLSGLEKALDIRAPIIGINNRDLKSLKIDLNTTLGLIGEIPKDTIIVSESGIRSRADVKRLEDAGVDAVLVGTILMESEDIGGRIGELRGEK